MGKLCSKLCYCRLVHSDEGGFTLIEMMVALLILFIVMTSLAYTATIASKYEGVARQRETAMGFSQQYFQEALALPFANIKHGLNPQVDSTYASDTNIVTDSTTCASHGASAPCINIPNTTTYESLVTNSGANGTTGVNSCSPSTPPLCPHKVTNSSISVVSGSAGSSDTYTTLAYITKPSSTVCTSCYRLIVASSWTDPVDPGASSAVTYQTLMTDTSKGCLGTTSHPFSGPCPTYLFGQALIPQGSIKVTGNTSGGTSVNGINLGTASITTPEDSTTSQTSQVSSVQALGQTSGISLNLGSSTASTIGNTYLPLASDNDPTLPDNSNPSPVSLSSDTNGSLSAIVGSSSPGSTGATACSSTTVNAICMTKAASDTTGNENAVMSGNTASSCASASSSVPCGASSGKLGSASGCTGTMSSCVMLHLFNGATDLGTCPLVSVGAPTSTSTAQVNQNTTAAPQPQTAAATRYFGQMTLGCIPSNVTPPTSWNVSPSGFTPVGSGNTGFLVGVKNGYSQSLQAQAGVASPTTSSSNSGTEWYYSPGIATTAGGTLSAALPTSTDTLSSIGTTNNALSGYGWTSSGTLQSILGSASSTWSSGGTVPSTLGDTSASWTSGGTIPSQLGNTTATWSSGGSLNAALGSTSSGFVSYGTSSGAITASSTSIKVSETSTPPATPFTIKIDSEQMNVTARTNGAGCTAPTYCYTVTRAYNGTTAATHNSGTSAAYQIAACASPCTFQVSETAAPPSATPFTIQIDSEQMTVTSRTLVSGSTYSYTATRPANSTTAATHTSGTGFSYQIPACASPCSVKVTETSAPPTSTPFTIQVDSEQMTVTSRTTGAGCTAPTYCYTVTRAVNGTTAAVHSAGASFSYQIAACPTSCVFNATETSAPPSAVPFTIQIDSEQMTVTSRALVSGSTYAYTATRAVNATTSAVHSAGASFSYQVPACPTSCTFNVTETSAPPSSVPFNIQVDSEQMTVTARSLVSGSTYSYTVTRAVNGTTAAVHSSGATFSDYSLSCTSSCSFDVNESGTPPSTPFVIQIDSEQMQVTSRVKYPNGSPPSPCVVSTQMYCYTVTRAYNGTTGAAHSSGATVYQDTVGCPSPCTFNVSETSTPPSTPFTIQVDSEQMSVTSRTLVSGSTYSYTATRAYNSTSAAAHSSGATVNFLSVPYGYVSQTDSGLTGTSISPTSVNYTTGGCTYQESLSGTLTSPSGGVTNTSTSGVVTNSAGTATAPLTGDFKFNVTCGATTVADLDINVALGTMKTTATYSAKAT